MPGTVPCADEDGTLLYHCLDVEQPVVEELAEEETAAYADAEGTARWLSSCSPRRPSCSR